MLGTAKLLSQLKEQCHGTLIVIGQPAEETVDGARAMLADDLYARFPKPDFAIALHDSADVEAGRVVYCPGYAMASSTSIDVLIRGVGGHGSKPEATKDPVVMAAQIILALQTIVSRENSPLDPSVVTVGSIHGGTKRNIIPDEVTLQLTTRTFKEDVRLRYRFDRTDREKRGARGGRSGRSIAKRQSHRERKRAGTLQRPATDRATCDGDWQDDRSR
jgi:hippurate hydrolase